VVGDLVLSFNDETVRRRRPDDGAEPSSPSHDTLNLHGSWAAALDQAEAANAVDRLDRQRQSPLADPGYRTRFTGHGTMVMPNSGWPDVLAGCMFTFGLGPASLLPGARIRADVLRVSAETSRAIACEVSGVLAGRA